MPHLSITGTTEGAVEMEISEHMAETLVSLAYAGDDTWMPCEDCDYACTD